MSQGTGKIMDLIPEVLRPKLIEEVKELLKESEKGDPNKPTKTEIDRQIQEWGKDQQSQHNRKK